MTFRFPVLKKILLLTLLIPVMVSAEPSSSEDPDRTAGDEAASAGDYLLASRFYGRYLARVKDHTSQEKEREAYEKYIDSLIRCGEYDRADELYADYFIRCGGSNPMTVTLLKAEILTGRKQYAEARPMLKRTLSGLSRGDPRRQSALSAFARVCEGTEAWHEAALTYGTLRDEQKDPALRMDAHEQALYCMASSETPLETLPESAKLPEYAGRYPDMLRLFTLYAMLRSGTKLETLQAAWNEAVKTPESAERASMRYKLWSSAGDLLAEKKSAAAAAEAYQRAFGAASSKKQSLETLKRLISVYETAGNLQKTVSPALMTYQLFEDSFVPASLKFRLAKLLRKAGHTKEAIEIFRNIIASSRSGKVIRTAASECALLCNETGKTADAVKLIEKHFTKENAPEGEYLKAELLFRRKEYRKAVEAFQSVAERFSAWHDRALHQKILARLAVNGEKQALEEAVRLEKTAADPLMRLKALFLQAMALENMGRFTDAGKKYALYAADGRGEPDLDIEALFKAGRFAMKDAKTGESRRCFQTILQRYPLSEYAPAAGAWVALTWRMEGNDTAAEAATWKTARKYPGSESAVEVLFELASHELKAGSVLKVRQILRVIQNSAPGQKTAFRIAMMQAASFLVAREYQNAAGVLNQLFEKDKSALKNPKALYLYADILKGSGDCRTALQWYEKAEAASTSDPVTAAAARGSCGDVYFMLAENSDQPSGLYERAAASFETTAKLSALPDAVRVMTLYKLGRTREMLGQDDRARAAYREAVFLVRSDSPEEETTFAAKAAEGLFGIASRRPLRSHVEDAARALRRLVVLKVLDRQSAEKRISALRKLQRSKHHF